MMIVCQTCKLRYDDKFRSTICPHQTFAANDGKNNFRHHIESPVIYPTLEIRGHAASNRVKRNDATYRFVCSACACFSFGGEVATYPAPHKDCPNSGFIHCDVLNQAYESEIRAVLFECDGCGFSVDSTDQWVFQVLKETKPKLVSPNLQGFRPAVMDIFKNSPTQYHFEKFVEKEHGISSQHGGCVKEPMIQETKTGETLLEGIIDFMRFLHRIKEVPVQRNEQVSVIFFEDRFDLPYAAMENHAVSEGLAISTIETGSPRRRVRIWRTGTP